MRSRISFASVLTILLVTAVNASAQEWARKMFDATSHDFGTVARGAKAEHRITITNLYEEEVVITGVRSSCGCTSPTLTKQQLKTFEKAELVAVFNTRSFQGDKSATLTVTFSKPFQAEVQIQIKGYIRSDVVLTPGIVEIGSINQGTGVDRKLSISYAGRSDWKILDVQTTNPHITCELTETQRATNQVGYDLVVHLAEAAPAGYLKEQLFLVTNDVRSKMIPVDVEGHIAPSVSVSPSSLFMGVLKPGQKVTKQLIVKAKKDFHIKELKCENECFHFEMPSEAKSVHVVPVTFEASDKTGRVSQKVQIVTDLGEELGLECVLYAQVLEERP